MAFPSSSATLVPKALAILRSRHPDITITFTEAEPPESLAALRQGECDLAVAFAYEGKEIGEVEEDLSMLVTHHLLDDELRLVVPKNHPQATKEVAEMGDFCTEEWIAGCPRCRGHLVNLSHDAGYSPNVAFETEDYVAVLGLVSAGLGVALVPDLILRAAKHDDVVALPLSPPSRRQILAVTTPDLQRVPAVAATIEALCEVARSVAEPVSAPA
jgi:DNA-binding transcriptional LysR family regulator